MSWVEKLFDSGLYEREYIGVNENRELAERQAAFLERWVRAPEPLVAAEVGQAGIDADAGAVVDGRFPGQPGLGVRRTRLHAALVAAAARAVENADSDGEGNTNLVEINANTQPGWCDTQNAGCSNSAGTPPNVALDPEPAAPANNPPMADAGGPYSGEAGSTLIQFDGSRSSDPDGDALTFEWEFGDGARATGMMPTHTYASAGNYEVIVTDDFSVLAGYDVTVPGPNPGQDINSQQQPYPISLTPGEDDPTADFGYVSDG